MMMSSCLLSFIPGGYVDVTKETSLGPCLGYNIRDPPPPTVRCEQAPGQGRQGWLREPLENVVVIVSDFVEHATSPHSH